MESLEVSLKIKNRTTIWSSILTPGHMFRENHNLKRFMHPNVHCSTAFNTQDMKATCPLTGEWIKMWYRYMCVYIYMYIYIHTTWWLNNIHIFVYMYCMYIYTHSGHNCKAIILQLKNKFKIKNKEWNSAICNNMDGLRGYRVS